MKVRLKKQPEVEGYIDQFNISTLGEVVGGIGDDYDSWYIKDLDVYLENKKEWKDMRQAFNDNDLIPDNFNTRFTEPRNEEEKKRGYYF